MKIRVLFLLVFTFISFAGKAQGLIFRFDSISSPPYICQATAFNLEVFGTKSTDLLPSTPSYSVSNNIIYINFYYYRGMVMSTPSPFQQQILIQAPPIGNYKILVKGINNGMGGSIMDTISTTLSVCGGITGITENEAARTELYPNPASGWLYLKSLAGNTTATIHDLTGKTLIRQHLTTENAAISLQNLSAGIYLLKLQSQKGTLVKKFVKE